MEGTPPGAGVAAVYAAVQEGARGVSEPAPARAHPFRGLPVSPAPPPFRKRQGSARGPPSPRVLHHLFLLTYHLLSSYFNSNLLSF